MGNCTQEHSHPLNSAGGFFAGLLMGGLVGTGAMLLLAPNSGRQTRAKIRQEGLELHRRVTDAAEGAVARVRGKARQITASVHKQVEQLEQHGQDLLDGQKERLSTVIEAGKTAVHTISDG